MKHTKFDVVRSFLADSDFNVGEDVLMGMRALSAFTLVSWKMCGSGAHASRNTPANKRNGCNLPTCTERNTTFWIMSL